MVAKITSPKNISRALNYNEKKVQQGKAENIHAANFLKDVEQMNFYDKLERFERLNSLNERAKTNTLHISLNFDAGDQLGKEKLIAISDAYMQKIGFGTQPYLVYQHHDSGHTHVHIVTNTIKEDGRRIDTYNIGRNQSEQARKEIEKEYSLVKADEKKRAQAYRTEPVRAERVQYGKSETKRAIVNVLDAVLTKYKYTSLAELNAVLQQYNVIADRGQQGSRTYEKKGLVYRALDENGQKIGSPIPASDLYNKPGLKYLKQQFEKNDQLRKADAQQVKTSIDWVLAGKPETLKGFTKALEKERVYVAVRQNAQGFVYGLTYIDHKTKAVFNGSDLGKEYSAKKILERLGYREVQEEKKEQAQSKAMAAGKEKTPAKKEAQQVNKQPLQDSKALANDLKEGVFKLAEKLTEAEQAPDNLPYELQEDNYKKKKKEQDLHWQQEM